jgi:hypothetical protein
MIVQRDHEARSTGLVVTGYVLAVLMPLIGFILGIVVATRPARATNKHGWMIIVLSVVAFIVFMALAINAAQTAVTTTP